MTLYHCTTDKKLKRYMESRRILSPVRGWIYYESAQNWCKKTGRNIILKIECDQAYPLPDHKPRGHAYWSPENINKWEIIK